MKKVFLALFVIFTFSSAAQAVYQNPNGPLENSSIVQGTYHNPNEPANVSQESYTPTELPVNGSGSSGGSTDGNTSGQSAYQNPNGQYQTGQQNPETVVQEISGSSSSNNTGNNQAPPQNENPAVSVPSPDGKFGNILILIAVLAIIMAVGYIYYRKNAKKGDDEDAVLRRLKEREEN